MSQKLTHASGVKEQQGVDHDDTITRGASGGEGEKCKDKNDLRGGGHRDVLEDTGEDSGLVKDDEIYQHYGDASDLKGATSSESQAHIESKSSNVAQQATGHSSLLCVVSTADLLTGQGNLSHLHPVIDSQVPDGDQRLSRGTQPRDRPDQVRRSRPQPEELNLKNEAHLVIALVTPVTLCMVVVVSTMASVNYYTEKGVYSIYTPFTPFHEETEDTATIAWQALVNVGIILVVIAVMSGLLVLAYKCKCYKFLLGLLFMSILLWLFLFTYLYLGEVLEANNLPMDYITLGIILWNFGVTGMISIYWKGPLLLQQAYLIFISSLMALNSIKYLPDWTTWAVLGVGSLWDLFAVLAPCGPIKILLETAQERNPNLFASLIDSSGVYSSGVIHPRQQQVGQDPRQQAGHQLEEDDDNGVMLGLGDFVLYSILVGKASSYGDWNTTLACFVAILIGLCLTMLCGALFRKALPALPISITFGLIFYFLTGEIVTPFCDILTSNQIFI